LDNKVKKAMAYCAVPFCKSNAKLTSQDESKEDRISFHRFPADSALNKAWIVAIRREKGKNFKVS
jgi:hypothetical protein